MKKKNGEYQNVYFFICHTIVLQSFAR